MYIIIKLVCVYICIIYLKIDDKCYEFDFFEVWRLKWELIVELLDYCLLKKNYY